MLKVIKAEIYAESQKKRYLSISDIICASVSVDWMWVKMLILVWVHKS